MATPLVAPFNVTTEKTNDKTIKITWDDKNASVKVSEYKISFLKKDTKAPFVPDNVGRPLPGRSKDGTTSYSVEITRDGETPTAADLASSYLAQVVDKSADPAADSDSEPGVQPYWEVNPSLTLKVGSRSFTLTKGSGPGGIYRLPVSRDDPFTITIKDVQDLAEATGIGRDNVPTRWPDGSEITDDNSLNIYKLAVDVDRKLVDLEIAFMLNFTLIKGLTVQEVGLSVLRTDGVTEL
jgi:hypothetical protein